MEDISVHPSADVAEPHMHQGHTTALFDAALVS